MGATVAVGGSMASPVHPPVRVQQTDGPWLQGNASSEMTVTFQWSTSQFDPLPERW